MMIRQLSVFLENKKGRLAEAAAVLAKGKINIRALSLADSADFGVLRLIVNDPDKGAECLRKAGMIVQETDVIAVEAPDRPGGLHGILKIFDAAGINIEYMYATVERIKDTLRRAENSGLNAFLGRGDRHIIRMLEEYRNEGGTL
ncbi:MAG: ACT domain-containing protein, partial [Candidatus Sumerlaeota bacterium]|nr:ACT domain-containing protein [Candidatus Sumerlaeota bacterium]